MLLFAQSFYAAPDPTVRARQDRMAEVIFIANDCRMSNSASYIKHSIVGCKTNEKYNLGLALYI